MPPARGGNQVLELAFDLADHPGSILDFGKMSRAGHLLWGPRKATRWADIVRPLNAENPDRSKGRQSAQVREQKLVIELDILAGNSKIDISHGGDTLFAFGLDERQCALASLELRVDADRYLTHETIPEGYQRGQILVRVFRD